VRGVEKGKSPKDLSVIHVVTNPADLAVIVEMLASTWPILVNFLRFATGQQTAKIIGDSNDLQHKRRGVSRGLFETLVTVLRPYYQRVIDRVKE
jgi:hypothetical protein